MYRLCHLRESLSGHALSLRAIEGIVANIDRCTMCGKCAEVCPTRAIEMSGKEYTEEDVLSIILKETNMMDFSDGGVTFSGGEPLMYPEALKSLLIRCGEEGIDRAVDTCGYVRSSVMEDVMPHTDLFLYDLKMINSQLHRQWTKADNEIILKNLQFIARSEKPYHIRIPLIDGVNTHDENIEKNYCFHSRLASEAGCCRITALSEHCFEEI
ncbi:MAG: glycyl-radical enzyme activating protein [Paludibacteraceae bacterium]